MAALLVALLLAGSVAPSESWRGTLCFGDDRSSFEQSKERCRPTTERRASFNPAEAERRYLWISEDQQQILLGVIPPGAASVELTKKVGGQFALTFAGDRNRGWPVAVACTFLEFSRDRTWEFNIPAKAVTKVRKLLLPPGPFRLTFKAAYHRSLSRDVVSRQADRPTPLGQFSFPPAPSVVGRVVNGKTGDPIFGAVIGLSSSETAALTGEDGRFRIELETDPPPFLLVERSGYGTRTVPLPSSGLDIVLPVVSLFQAASLEISVVRPEQEKPTRLELKLLENPGNRKLQRVLGTRNLSVVDSRAEFENLSSGEYTLLVKGDQPLQQFVRRIAIEEGNVTKKEIRLTSRLLEGQVFFGRQPVSDVAISLGSGPAWKANISPNVNGEFGGPLWQEGPFIAVVTGGPLHEPFGTSKELYGSDRIPWDLVIPDRRIYGRVIDETSNAPLAGAAVSIESESPDLHFSHDATTDSSGHYEFTAVSDGQHKLSAQADKHVPASPVVVSLAEEDSERRVDFSLKKGVELSLRILDAWGAPAANAGILAIADGLNPEYFTSDATGTFAIAISEVAGKTLYIVPREGSFLIARIDASMKPDGDTQSIPLQVPAGLSSLAILTRAEGGEPIANVSLLMRFNGQVMPPEVLRTISSVQGSAFRTGADGQTILRSLPSGLYEFWPYQSPQEAQGLLPSLNILPAPVRIGLSAGEQTVTLTFSPKRSNAGSF